MSILLDPKIQEIIRNKFHGITDEQWADLKNRYPYNEIPAIISEVIRFKSDLNSKKERIKNLPVEELLKENGWTIECQSPLEIRHFEGSFASGMAAKFTIDAIRQEAIDNVS